MSNVHCNGTQHWIEVHLCPPIHKKIRLLEISYLRLKFLKDMVPKSGIFILWILSLVLVYQIFPLGLVALFVVGAYLLLGDSNGKVEPVQNGGSSPQSSNQTGEAKTSLGISKTLNVDKAPIDKPVQDTVQQITVATKSQTTGTSNSFFSIENFKLLIFFL